MEIFGFNASPYMYKWNEIPRLIDFDLEVEDDIFTQMDVLLFLLLSLFLLNLLRKHSYNKIPINWRRKLGNNIGECWSQIQMNETYQEDLFLYNKINACTNHSHSVVSCFIEFLKEKIIHGILKKPVKCDWKDNLKLKHHENLNLLNTHYAYGKPKHRSKSKHNPQRSKNRQYSLLLKSSFLKDNLGVQLRFSRTTAGYAMIINSSDYKSSVVQNENIPDKINGEYCRDLQRDKNNNLRRNKNENVKITVFEPKDYKCTDPVKPHSISCKSRSSNRRSSSARCYLSMKSLSNEVKKNSIFRIQGSPKHLPGRICCTNIVAGTERQNTENKFDDKKTMAHLTCTKSFTPIELTVSRRRTKDSRISSRVDATKFYDDRKNKASSLNSIKEAKRSERHETSLKHWTNKLTEIKTVHPIVLSVNKDKISTTSKGRQLNILKKKEPHGASQQNLLRPEKIHMNNRLGQTEALQGEIIEYRDDFHPFSVIEKSYPINQDMKSVKNETKRKEENQYNGRLHENKECHNSKVTSISIPEKETQDNHESSNKMIEKGGGDCHLTTNNVQCNVCKPGKTDGIFSLKMEDKCESYGEKKNTYSRSGTNEIVYDKVLMELKSRFKKVKSEKSNHQLENLFRNLKRFEATTESQMTLAMSLSDIKTIERLRKEGIYHGNCSCTPTNSFLTPKHKKKSKFVEKCESDYSNPLGSKEKKHESNQRNEHFRKPLYFPPSHEKSTFSNEKTKGSIIEKHSKKIMDSREQFNRTRDENLNCIFKKKNKRKKLRTYFQRIYDRKFSEMKKQNYCTIPECRCGGKFGWLEAHHKYAAMKDRLWFCKFRRYYNFSELRSSYN